MAQIWFKNNKAAEKYTEEDIVKILEDTLKWIEENDGSIVLDEEGKPEKDNLGKEIRKPCIKLKTQLQLYMLKEHGVSHETCRSWVNDIHIKNKSITGLWEVLDLILETRMVYDKELRPTIQGMVLQNKHNYREKKDMTMDHRFSKMPKVMIGEKPLNITGENEDGTEES